MSRGIEVSGGGVPTFPSPADLICLLFYPLMLGALAVTVRRYVRRVAWSVWLDGVVGSLGAAAVLAVVLRPVLDSHTAGPRSLATVVAIAPPVFDLLLVATFAGIAALPGERMGRRWPLLAAGLIVFTAADVTYALSVNKGAWSPADPATAGFAVGLALVATWVDGAGQRDRPETCAALDNSFAVEDVALHSSVSIGIALFPDDGPDLSTLLSKADIAMYKAETSFTGHHVYCIADDAEDAARLQTVQELRTALASDQLVVHYQPKIDLGTGHVHGVEALACWDHPTRGLLLPEAFLNLAEESGLMPTLTPVVLAQALDQIGDWQAQGQPLTVAVSLSASALVDSDLPEQVASMLAARGVSPGSLQLEINEEFLMADRDRARTILTRLRDSGIQISVTDFGSGYSSLSYLRDLPIDELKLDPTFISPMAQDARTAALVASTIAMAHSLGLRMVAEGVEDNIAYAALARLG
ncbi:MAG TPA: GGDEF domain-containing phosphodiesterase, partial [Dermatophilaceae bacterium]